MKVDKLHCSQHGAVGQKIKNGRCELCWPPKPIKSIAQIVDLLEVEVAASEKVGFMGRAEDFKKILNYIKNK